MRMMDEIQPEFTDAAFSAMEREIAALFFHILTGVADEAGSDARQARIMQRVREKPTGEDGQPARIDRILNRIQGDRAAGGSAAVGTEAKV